MVVAKIKVLLYAGACVCFTLLSNIILKRFTFPFLGALTNEHDTTAPDTSPRKNKH